MRKVVFAVAALAAVFSTVAIAQQQCVEHRSPELGFSIQFPQAPQVASERRQSKSNPTVFYTENTFQAAADGREYFLAVYEYSSGTLPAKPDVKYWSARVQDFAKGSDTSVVREGPIKLSGQAGVEAVTVGGDGSRYLLDITLRGQRLYIMVSGGREGHESSAEAIRFLDSLRLLGG